MGRTREAKRVQSRIDTESDRINQDYDEFNRQRQGYGDAARGRSDLVFNEALDNYRNFIGSGGGAGFGIGPEARAGFRRYSRGGGLSPENINNLRAGGTFAEFARTGGLSEADKGTFRARGTASIPRFYENVRNNLATARAAQGNYAPGYDAQMAASTRDQANAFQDAATGVEADILDRVSRGRQWGAEGMSGAEQALVAALQRGEMFGIEGLARSDMFDSENDYRNRGLDLAAIEGMRGLRTDTPGEVDLYERSQLAGMGQRNQATAGMIDRNMAYNPGGNWWDRWGRDLAGFGVGVAGTFAGGGGPAGAGGGGWLQRLQSYYRRRGGGPAGPMPEGVESYG